MAKVRTISQGIPISSEVLQEHAAAINEMHEQIFSQAAGVTVVTKGIKQTPVRVTQGQFYGETVAVLTNSKVSTATPEKWSVLFNPVFASGTIPAVTATLMIPQDAASPAAAQEANVIITSVSATGASGTINFPKEGENVTLLVSVIAIGAAG